MLGYLIPRATAEKLQIVKKKDSLDLLRKYMSDDLIPQYCGGKHAFEGDPECRKILAPGGPIPEAAVQRFEEMVAGGMDSPAAYLAAAGRRSRAASKDGTSLQLPTDRASNNDCGVCPHRASNSEAVSRRSCC